MEGKEPPAGLVYTFGDEIRRIIRTAIHQFFVLERIVELSVRHRTRIEPNVYQVRFTLHRFACRRNQDDIVYIRTVQIYLIVIFFRIFSRNEAQFLVRILHHEASLNRFFDFIIQFFYRADADFRAILVAPDRKRSSPIARTAQVPVIQVLQPFSETSRTGRFRFPVNGLVQLNHPFLASRRADKPAVQRIVKHRLVGTPAVRIVVHVLFHFERLVRLLHLHADIYIKRFSCLRRLLIIFAIDGELRVVCILHPSALILLISIYVHTLGNELLVQFVQQVELSGQVPHRTCLAFLVNHEERRDACGFCHESIVSTERRSDMHDTRTVFYGHIVTRNDTDSFCRSVMPVSVFVQLYGFHPREKLFVFHAYQVRPFVSAHYLERHQLVARLVVFQCHAFRLLVEVCIKQSLCQDHRNLLAGIRIVSLYGYIIYLRTYAKRGVRRQGPRSGGPCQEVRSSPLRHFWFRVLYFELPYHSQVFYVPITSRLVQFVRAKPRTCRRRIGLDGISFVEQAFLIKLLQEPPQGFDVAVVIRNIRIIQVHPIAHLVGQVGPFLRELHYVRTAMLIVFSH